MRSRPHATALAAVFAAAAAFTIATPFAGPRAAEDDAAIAHVLNRIAFGPRSGDVERVRAIGLERYVEQQLHPERLHDDALDARLVDLKTLTMSSRQIADAFEIPQLQARRARKQETPGDGGEAGPRAAMHDPERQRANLVLVELAEQKILRAVYSERQLQEVLTDFWFNHFNVDARKGPARFMLTEYERETIRPRVLGRFRNLLEADAKSPAMLFYLDNWMSAGSGTGLGPRNPRKGLNENYGRELLELHTLGVDGGYTQADVTEVARAFTGWTIREPRRGGGFAFEPRLHDPGQKIVLGHPIRAGGGMRDGEMVLDILARHPSTARFIATKLARRLVGDDPPPALVDRAAARFHATDGDLREVTRTILTSPEFLSPDAYHAKMKTPLEFVASALRSTGADVREAKPLVRAMQQFGMPLYMCQPPTGYKDTADAWTNTGAIVARMNFALQLANNRLNGVSVDTGEPADKVALALGAPEFQRR